jgi:hypothetical protein
VRRFETGGLSDRAGRLFGRAAPRFGRAAPLSQRVYDSGTPSTRSKGLGPGIALGAGAADLEGSPDDGLGNAEV